MHLITAILRSDNSNEAVVECNGEKYRITAYDLESLDICEGDLVDDSVIDFFERAVERLSCIKKAFDYLSYGDLSRKQLKDKLCRKFSKELAEDVVALFAERGYLNDEQLALRYAETFYEFKNMGLSRIKNELYRRGFSKEDIENAISKYENEDQGERVEEFITKKYDMTKMNDIKYRRKVYSGAVRAGFSGSDVSDFLRNFESENE